MSWYFNSGGTSAADPTALAAAGFTWPNTNETAFLTVPAGTVEWATVGKPVYVTDGTNKGVLFIAAVYSETPESPGVQIVELLNTHPTDGSTAFGSTTIYGGVGP